jgi:hypothetical protein
LEKEEADALEVATQENQERKEKKISQNNISANYIKNSLI